MVEKLKDVLCSWDRREEHGKNMGRGEVGAMPHERQLKLSPTAHQIPDKAPKSTFFHNLLSNHHCV